MVKKVKKLLKSKKYSQELLEWNIIKIGVKIKTRIKIIVKTKMICEISYQYKYKSKY
jgi:hypothetical protein